MIAESIRGAVHAPPAVTAADDRDEPAGLLIVVSRDEVARWLLRGPARPGTRRRAFDRGPYLFSDRLTQSETLLTEHVPSEMLADGCYADQLVERLGLALVDAEQREQAIQA